MTGISSYSTVASENVQANTGINWDEGMSPAAVNNSARANMADVRSQWNDAPWFQYGIGSKTVPHVYASATSTTLAGGDATAFWHAGRRVRAVGSSTGTIYGNVSSSSYGSSTTTVNYTWESGSLSNETLAIYAALPVTGNPITNFGVVSATGAFTTTSNSGYTVSALGETVILNTAGLTSTAAVTVIAATGGVILNTGATSWSAVSDEDKKTGLSPIADALAKLATLRTVTGRFKVDPVGTSRSFLIAQDVQKVLPEAVSTGKDGTLYLRYDDVIPLVVAAIKELAAKCG